MSTTTTTTKAPSKERSWLSDELLDTLRDALGPARCSERPLPDFATYWDNRITVVDGCGPERVALTAHLGQGDCIISYSAVLTHGDLLGCRREAAGPVWADCSDDPEDHPTLTHILPLITRLECWDENLRAARVALEAADLSVDTLGPSLIVWDTYSPTPGAGAWVEVDQINGAVLVSGQYASKVREILSQAGIF